MCTDVYGCLFFFSSCLKNRDRMKDNAEEQEADPISTLHTPSIEFGSQCTDENLQLLLSSAFKQHQSCECDDGTYANSSECTHSKFFQRAQAYCPSRKFTPIAKSARLFTIECRLCLSSHHMIQRCFLNKCSHCKIYHRQHKTCDHSQNTRIRTACNIKKSLFDSNIILACQNSSQITRRHVQKYQPPSTCKKRLNWRQPQFQSELNGHSNSDVFEKVHWKKNYH